MSPSYLSVKNCAREAENETWLLMLMGTIWLMECICSDANFELPHPNQELAVLQQGSHFSFSRKCNSVFIPTIDKNVVLYVDSCVLQTKTNKMELFFGGTLPFLQGKYSSLCMFKIKER